VPRFVFEADLSVEQVIYLDADLWFRQHPKPIFDEFNASGKQILITDHGYAPEYDQSATSGRYCEQFITFTHKAENAYLNGGKCSVSNGVTQELKMNNLEIKST
jgi:hypothetical protein